MKLHRCVGLSALLLAATMLLTGCVADSAGQKPSSSQPFGPTAPSGEAAPSTQPQGGPVLDPAGTVADNLPYFDLVNERLLAGDNPGGRAIVDNLVAGGFDKSAMQVTADKTPRGVDVDSLQFSVQFGDDCLIGQIGAGGYTSVVGAALAAGGCLVGKTRPIDW